MGKGDGPGFPGPSDLPRCGRGPLRVVSSQAPQAESGHQQQGTRQQHRETVGPGERQVALLRTRGLSLLCRSRRRRRGRIARRWTSPGGVLAEHLLVGRLLLPRWAAYLLTEHRLLRRRRRRSARLRALGVALRAVRLRALGVALRAVRLRALGVALRAVRVRAL